MGGGLSWEKQIGAGRRGCDGAMVRDRCGGGIGTTGWLGSSISGSTFFLSREREIEQRTAGVAGSASGWLGVARDGREQRAGSREQRAESEKRDREVKWSKSSTRVLENGLRKFCP